MPLLIVRNDICRMQCDAIVNATNSQMLPSGGADAAIHSAAGEELAAACARLKGCRVGEAKLTPGFKLPCKFVIHTVGPVWRGGLFGEEKQLRSCYSACLELAKSCKCESLAFPLIAAGSFGYPAERAMKLARSVISDFLAENDMTVYLVIYGGRDYLIGKRLFTDIESFIDDRYTEQSAQGRNAPPCAAASAPYTGRRGMRRAAQERELEDCCVQGVLFAPMPCSISDYVTKLDESFSQMLLRKIDESGMTDSQCYNKANIDRRLFSKIRSDAAYKPSKPTVLAFAIALELPMEELKSLLEKAGYALSHSSKSDLIVEYFVLHGNYNIFDINEALLDFDQIPLGAK